MKLHATMMTAALGLSTVHTLTPFAVAIRFDEQAPTDHRSTSAFVQSLITPATLTIADLGWSQEQARELRSRLGAFADDWDDPSMDLYDDL